MSFTTPPPPILDSQISFPTPSILLITLNRPKDLNCINTLGHHQLDALLRWYDREPALLCAILTGTGRAFCAGADLKEWNRANAESKSRPQPSSGFGGLSRRNGKKPVICAVNGICFGGGCEMIINADMVIADQGAQFALPEVKIGVVALAGALTRLTRTVGRQRAMEMALTGRTVSAEEAREWGIVNKVVEKGRCVEEAIRMAGLVAANSPDSVIVSREGVKMGWEGVGAEEGTRLVIENWYSRMDGGENMKEGVRSFVEKRKPRWVPSKL
ncbi:enoyl-CoA hydratase/carnithine racemase [Mollisia scopiformis]|uniref:Enoyl-CoA hydratase/carnithine racemase n=1 Tax=Mollisia scopiformis TaxID=149040 RepID=A0A132BDQ2_MOLSC|nr:enoyl-CoA hydratase/carnithine racemase [Mollisia scopiformis]KUJ10550.1 enoyl-CoA hydratase/carnithine racemase [Mollisia scopiformis]